MPGPDAPLADPDAEALRIALLVYRGNPHSGGQGVYTRELGKALLELGHQVTVFSGQPWPELTEGVPLVPVASMDLFRKDDPFRYPALHEFRDAVDLLEFGIMKTGAFPEPKTFSLRVRRLLQRRMDDFDVIHDNQCLGTGIEKMVTEDGWPLLETLHHPITVDYRLEREAAIGLKKRFGLSRWYAFLKMQKATIPHLRRIVTVSESSKKDIIAEMGGRPDQLHIVPVGVDLDNFGPLPEIARIPGRIMCTTSSDMPLKGLVPLLEAVAKLRTERPEVELQVIGGPKVDSTIPGHIARLGLEGAVRFNQGITSRQITELYASAELAVVPSLYEGFSLPAIEAMACAVPLVATTGGALPEVVGPSGGAGVLVPPGDPEALAATIGRLLDDPAERARLGQAGRDRVLARFTWQACAKGTVEHYRWVLEDHARRGVVRRFASATTSAGAARTPA